ncbi:MAG: hypothetical protein J6Z23_07875 [Lachnospiraceae bacterium]|nr:hypothetical protein [Lachnospiraceae bacterium]
MLDFIGENLEWILGILAILFFAVQVFFVLRKAKKIDREGIETDAIVSRVVEDWDSDSSETSYTTYVRYTDEKGKQRESAMTLTTNVEYAEGQWVRIRFLPGDYKMVRPVKEESPYQLH